MEKRFLWTNRVVEHAAQTLALSGLTASLVQTWKLLNQCSLDHGVGTSGFSHTKQDDPYRKA